MRTLLIAYATVLLLTIVASLVRVERGPTPADRMLAAQLFGTTGVATLVILAEAFDAPALRNVALVFAVLAAMASVAFVKRTWHSVSGDVVEREGDAR